MRKETHMRKNHIREKKIQCGEEYMAVGVYSVTEQEHRHREKKHKESSRGQKDRNKAASMRRYQRKALANFSKRGFFITGTYEEEYLPEELEDCARDVKNYLRRVKRATVRRFGVDPGRIRMMLWAMRNGDTGRLHMHGFAECVGLGEAERREWRELLEDLWRRRIPGTVEFDPLGTCNVDRMDVKKLLGVDGQGVNGTLGYIYGHKERVCIETQSLVLPVEQVPNDSKWSRKQLRRGCKDHAEDKAWWEERYPGWECVKVMIFDPGGLHESEDRREKGWEATEPQAYVILRKKEFAKART